MIECRPITTAEAPSYLRVLCRIFDLDPGRAQAIFYHEPFYDLERKWALFQEGSIRSVLTTVPLLFGDGPAAGIAGVGTLSDYRNRGFGQALVEAAMAGCAKRGEDRVLLFATDPVLYDRCGLKVLDHVVRAKFQEVPVGPDADLLNLQEVMERYDGWAEGATDRLRRDERRWNFWKWNLRMCASVSDGYLCQEGQTVRECLFDEAPKAWPIFAGAEWFGLESMARQFALPLQEGKRELLFMGRGFDRAPQMFLTDQF